MAKKSKRKAIKTGCKNANNGKYITSVHLGLDIQSETFPEKDDLGENENTVSKSRGRKKGKLTTLLLCENSNAKQYPIDVWYHISRHIKPEQIKKFSLICRDSWHITRTLQFWLSLYHKFVCNSQGLPLSLQPQNIDARPGIKARVVRALFYNYNLFKGKSIEDPSSQVIGRKCVLVWWEKEFSTKRNTNIWLYNFKLSCCNEKKKDQESNDVCFNNEKNNCILKIKCPNYIYIPSVNGMILTSFNNSMSSDMRYHQLKLIFHNEKRIGKYHKNEGLIVIINPVIEFDVINWWSPLYPYK